ncbi:MAG: hypothetical protein J6K64_04845 [Clostridia bacterium]|nr:hypothetical protein [Clostridia bacterium]
MTARGDNMGNKKMMKAYMGLWGVIAVVYGLWMSLFMGWDKYPYIIPTEADMALPAEEFIAKFDGMLYEPLFSSPVVYWIWVAASTALLLLYAVFIRKILFADKLTKATTVFCAVNLIAGFAFITWYGFLSFPEQFGNILTDVTASMLGLRYPWYFRIWGVLASLSIFTNTLYMYRKNNYEGKAGVIVTSLGCAAIFVTVNVPSAGLDLVMTARCLSHWATALIFAFLGAAGVIIFLLHKFKQKDKKYMIATIVFVAVLVLMLVLLVTVGKSAFIENLPMWVAYALLFIINFTSFFDKKEIKAKEKETANV